MKTWEKPRKPDYPANPPPSWPCMVFMPTILLAAVIGAIINLDGGHDGSA